MKKITLLLLLLLLLPLLSIGQWSQLGNSINGYHTNEEAGHSVSINSDGTVMAMGIPYYGGGNGANSGRVVIYKRNSGSTNWSQVGSSIIGEALGDTSGYSVSLSGDGSVVVIGGRGNDGNGIDSGHVRVYKNVSNNWVQVGLDIDGEATGDKFGHSVSINSDGSVLAAGARFNDGNGVNSGHVRVFKNINDVWTQIGLDIDGEALGDGSGYSVSLSSDGSIVAIGANGNDGNGADSGHVRVFKNINDVWTQTGLDIDGEIADGQSGVSISLSGNGSTIAVGATKTQSNKGQVRVFKNVNDVWTQIGITILGEKITDYFGYSVSLNEDGNILAAGAYTHEGWDSGYNNLLPFCGRVRVFQNVNDTWDQVGLGINGEASGDRSGSSVSLNNDGSILAIGAYRYDSGWNTDTGYARVFRNNLLSINENTFGEQFSAYPNPSSGLSKIQLGENYNTVSVNVFNVLGKQVASQKYNNIDEVELNTQEYATGIYFIKVQSGTKEATIKLVVK